MIILPGQYFSFNKASKTLTAEISELRLRDLSETVIVKGNHHSVKYTLVGVDTDGEDVYGWRFHVSQSDMRFCAGAENLLIIND